MFWTKIYNFSFSVFCENWSDKLRNFIFSFLQYFILQILKWVPRWAPRKSTWKTVNLKLINSKGRFCWWVRTINGSANAWSYAMSQKLINHDTRNFHRKMRQGINFRLSTFSEQVWPGGYLFGKFVRVRRVSSLSLCRLSFSWCNASLQLQAMPINISYRQLRKKFFFSSSIL